MTHPALLERITRSLAYMLRHQPERFGLQLDPHGFGAVPDVVRALNERLGEPVDERDLEEAIASGDRPRYEIQEGRVRALYGHSIAVEPGEPGQPPEFLFVGIDARDADRAARFGLRGGRRRFLHLALNVDDAREAGRRAGRDYSVLRIFALDAWEEGINFYDRKALFLAEHLPTQFLEVLETNHDGYEPRDEHGPGGDGRGGHSDRREHDHGRRGGHGHRDHGWREHGRRDHARGDRGRGEPARVESRVETSDRGGQLEAQEQRAPAAESPRHEGGGRFRGGHRERGPRQHEQRQHEHAGASAQQVDRPREGHGDRRDRGDRPPRRDDRRHERRDEHRGREGASPAPQRSGAAAPVAREGATTDFGVGVFEPERRESPPPPRRAPEPVAPPPRPVERRDDAGDFGAGL